MSKKKYRINEIFYSLQGEGRFTGIPAVFVRFSGCNRKCAFCDTAHLSFTEMTVGDILASVSEFPARHIVITGGEPAMQLDDELVCALHEAGCFVQVETNGSLPLPDATDWVTCSPKTPPFAVRRVNELKILFPPEFVVDPDSESAERYFEGLSNKFLPLFPIGVKPVLSLQPCSGDDEALNHLTTEATVKYILNHPHWRLSLQTHKLINIK